MNRSFKIKLASAMVFFTAFAAVSSTIAWFIPAVSVTNSGEITGVTEGAYYAYGEGTAEKPFGITRPRHLYNLAWLQYLGTYNKASENGKPYYFELGDNVDMTDWVLPPIGDENTPFYGNFNGNGYVVSNLTISNDFNDLGKHPSTVSTFNQPHILGFFGVIGNYSGATLSAYSSSANEFLNTGLTGLTVKTVLKNSLIGIAAGYVDATMKNVAVDASTLNVAYSGNDSTSYGSHTSNISDYSLVGYTTKKSSIKKAEETIYSVNVSSGYEFNATDQGESTGWGGSIDMMSVTKRLQTIRDNYATKASASNPFVFREDNIYIDGELDTNQSESYTDDNYYTYLYNSNDAVGHFNFLRESSNEGSRYALMGGGHWETNEYYLSYSHSGHYITDGTNYLSLDGNGFQNSNSASDASLWSFPDGSGYIYSSWEGTTYYLVNSNGTLSLTTSQSSATTWSLTVESNVLKITNGNYKLAFYSGNWKLISSLGDTYYTFNNGTNYLGEGDDNNEIETVTSANAAHWSIDGNGHYYYISNSIKYYLGRYYYYTYRNRRYSESEALQVCAIAEEDIDDYFTYYELNGNYLQTQGKYVSNRALNNGTFYVRYNSGWTSTRDTSNRTAITRNTNHVTIPNYDNLGINDTTNNVVTKKGPDNYLDKNETGMNYEDNDVTYFPLSTVNNTNNFNPSDNNTAYVVGGSAIKSNTTSLSSNLTNVRFGYYPIVRESSWWGDDQLNIDFNTSSGEFTKIYTINDSSTSEPTDITNSTAYERLSDAKTNLGGVLKKDGTNVYGLHFMDATISMDALTTAKSIKVNKQTYTNYQLPVNSIDFHLKEFGYINFMAGSYYYNSTSDRNNSFFSLYQIYRTKSDPTKINMILEVQNIYKHTSGAKNYSYVLQLKDTVTGTIYYTRPYKIIDSDGNKEWIYDNSEYDTDNQFETAAEFSAHSSDYSIVFKCDWIKKNSFNHNTFDYHAYYFEIPVNDGEFCLGSVSGAVGAYLMYLDIGANAAKTQRTILYEKFTLTEKNYSYPLGVSLYTLPEAESIESNTKVIPFVIPDDDTNLIDASDSACMTIKASSSGVFEIDRNGSDVALTRAQAANAPPVYSGEDITLLHESGSSTALEVTAESSNTYTIKRMQYYDYNVNLETTTVTMVTDTSVNGGAYSRTIYQYNYTSSDTTGDPNSTYAYDQSLDTPLDQRANIKIYNTTTGIKIDENTMISTSSFAINDSELSDSVILAIRLVQTGGDEYDDDTRLVAVVNTSDTSGTYYIFNQYKITLTPESGSIRITVTNYVTGNTIYFGTTQVTGKDQVITIPAP